MFEDFKEKIRELDYLENGNSSFLPSEIESELRAQGLDPDTVTLEKLFPEELDTEGNDYDCTPTIEDLGQS